MASGVPVIASDLPAVRELLEPGETGTLVRPARPAALARAVRKVLDTPQDAGLMAEKARHLAETRFSWADAVDAQRKVYDEVCRS